MILYQVAVAAASGLVGELGKGDNQRLFAKVETGKLVKKWEVAGPHGCFGRLAERVDDNS